MTEAREEREIRPLYLYKVSDEGMEPVAGWEVHCIDSTTCIGDWSDRRHQFNWRTDDPKRMVKAFPEA